MQTYFYRSSCSTCQRKIPIIYFLNSLSDSNNNIKYYDVDNKDNKYIIESMNVTQVPSSYYLTNVNGILTFRQFELIDHSIIISALIGFICNSLMLALIVFMFGFFIATYIRKSNYNSQDLIE